MPTPGLMFALSKPKDPKTSEEQYNRFYNEEHLPDVLTFFKKAGINPAFALRYKNNDPEAKLPFLALYPLPDAQYIFSPDMQQTLPEQTKESKVLGLDNIWENLDLDIRPYEKIQTFEGYGHASKSGNERGKTIVCVAMEPGEGEGQEQDLDDWYRKQHLDMMSMARNYRRTTRYKRMDDQKPRYLALHEYACRADELPTQQIEQLKATEWSKKILDECSGFDRDVFELTEAQGEVSEKL